MRPNQISFWRLALQQGGADLTAHERVIAKVIAAYDAALAAACPDFCARARLRVVEVLDAAD